MSYAFIIEKDFIFPNDEKESFKGRTFGYGPLGFKCKGALAKGEGKRFLLRDDDEEPCYEGRIVHTRDDEELFAPLDGFGIPNAGCTEIHYLTDMKWQRL